MKKNIIILVAIISFSSCKKNNEDQVSNGDTSVQNEELSTKSFPEKEKIDSNNLCQINGRDWNYTMASGIVSTHARTKKRTALITFTKKLKKGSESIQLHYDTDSFELIAVSLILKFPKKEEKKLFTCYYDLNPDTRDRYPESELSGTIDLSDSTSTSGTAEIKNLNIKYEKENLQNAEDAVISVTGLKFTNIGYSDIDNLFKPSKE